MVFNQHCESLACVCLEEEMRENYRGRDTLFYLLQESLYPPIEKPPKFSSMRSPSSLLPVCVLKSFRLVILYTGAQLTHYCVKAQSRTLVKNCFLTQSTRD